MSTSHSVESVSWRGAIGRRAVLRHELAGSLLRSRARQRCLAGQHTFAVARTRRPPWSAQPAHVVAASFGMASAYSPRSRDRRRDWALSRSRTGSALHRRPRKSRQWRCRPTLGGARSMSKTGMVSLSWWISGDLVLLYRRLPIVKKAYDRFHKDGLGLLASAWTKILPDSQNS